MSGSGGTECTSCFNPHGAMGIEDTASYAYICVTLRGWIKSASALLPCTLYHIKCVLAELFIQHTDGIPRNTQLVFRGDTNYINHA